MGGSFENFSGGNISGDYRAEDASTHRPDLNLSILARAIF
jgi:hypothetical protein